jgi:hypothetical protein
MAKTFDPTPPVITRRTMLKGAAATAAVGLAPSIAGARRAHAAAEPKTLVVASPSIRGRARHHRRHGRAL